MVLENIQSSEDMISVSESTLTIDSLSINSITPITEGHNLLSISYSDFNVSNVSYHDSSLELMAAIFSTGSIYDLIGSNITKLADSTISLDYVLFLRSTTIYNFDSIHFENISLSSSKLIDVINSNLNSLKNHNISNTNSVIYTLDRTNVYNGETVSIFDSVSAFHIIDSTLIISSSSFRMLNSTLLSALYSESSNVTISNSTFDSNIAKQGAAITLLCDHDQSCVSSIDG